MDTIAGLPFAKLEFANDGSVADGRQLAELLDHIRTAKPTRLAVVSHGWRNDAAEASALYTELFTNVAERLNARGTPAPTVVGIYWTSMALPEEFGEAAQSAEAEDGAVALAVGPGLDPHDIGKWLDRLKTFGGAAELDRAKALLDRLEYRATDQVAFVKLLRKVAPPTSDPREDNSDEFFGQDEKQMFERLSRPIFEAASRSGEGDGFATGLRDGVAALGASFLNSAQGELGAAFRLVNYLTFYQMKERAGVIGAGLNGALARVRAEFPAMPIHMVGHSFGARVVTTAAAGGAKLDPCSLSLLQGAYSHNGLAAASEWDGGKDGFFRAIFSQRLVSGPIVATHTANDRAVGVAYPIASRLAGQNADALGDANDPFGGVGRNGVLHTLASERAPNGSLLSPHGVYSFAKGKTNNLLSDAFVKNHGDVRNPAVANAVAQVIESL